LTTSLAFNIFLFSHLEYRQTNLKDANVSIRRRRRRSFILLNR